MGYYGASIGLRSDVILNIEKWLITVIPFEPMVGLLQQPNWGDRLPQLHPPSTFEG
jgi:hypothetical protein